jgi:two-component system, OmpR family, response regulator
VAGLDAGADDYLVKPFSFIELLARVRSVIRRGPAQRPTVLEVDGLTLDPATRHVQRNGQAIELSAKEFSLLEYFMRHPGEVLTRTQILEHVWDFAYDGTSNVVDVYVRYLRAKIDRPFGLGTIETVRGAGYRLHKSVSGG